MPFSKKLNDILATKAKVHKRVVKIKAFDNPKFYLKKSVLNSKEPPYLNDYWTEIKVSAFTNPSEHLQNPLLSVLFYQRKTLEMYRSNTNAISTEKFKDISPL